MSGDGWSLKSIKGCCGAGSGRNAARSGLIGLSGCLVSVIMGFSSVVSRPVLKFSRPKDWALSFDGWLQGQLHSVVIILEWDYPWDKYTLVTGVVLSRDGYNHTVAAFATV